MRLLARNPDKVGITFFCFKFPLYWVSLRNFVYSLIVLFQVKKVFNDIFGEEEGPVQFEKVFNSQCNFFFQHIFTKVKFHWNMHKHRDDHICDIRMCICPSLS